MKDLLLSGRLAARHMLFATSNSCGRWVKACRDIFWLSKSELNPFARDLAVVTESERPNPSLAFGLSRYLREPLAPTLAALNANQRYLAEVEQMRNRYASTTRLKSHIEQFAIPQSMQFQELINSDPRSRILASFHFGDFLYGLNKLVSLQPGHITTKVLSHANYSQTFLENMARGFGDKAPTADTQLLLADAQVQTLSAFLRLPNTSLLMFADLPASYGATVRTQFLGRWAWFPRGIAVLALASDVPILPVICFSTGRDNRVEMGKQIEAVRLVGESREAAITRITQRLLDYFVDYFYQYRQQWRYLALLPEYFIDPCNEPIRE
jgi:predicted LPLAT superfamily acyltransferase